MNQKHGIVYGGHLIVANPTSGSVQIVPKERLQEKAVKVRGKPITVKSKRELKESLEALHLDDTTIQKTLDHFMVKSRGGSTGGRQTLSEAGKDLSYLKPVQQVVYVSGGWTMRGDHVAGKINEAELSAQQLRTMLKSGLISLTPNGKKQFLAKFKSPTG